LSEDGQRSQDSQREREQKKEIERKSVIVRQITDAAEESEINRLWKREIVHVHAKGRAERGVVEVGARLAEAFNDRLSPGCVRTQLVVKGYGWVSAPQSHHGREDQQ
jgi:hypothetical protein